MSVVDGRIVRYLVQHYNGNGNWHIREQCRTLEEQAFELRRVRLAPCFINCPSAVQAFGTVELEPNRRIREAGLDKADALLTDIGKSMYEAVGTPEELIDAGLAEAYMFETLGKSRTCSRCDEFGDSIRIMPRGKTRFELRRYFREGPYTPHANCKLPPGAPRRLEDVDVGPLLAQFQRSAA